MLCVVLRSWYEYSLKHQSETVWLLACMVGKMISISMAHLYRKITVPRASLGTDEGPWTEMFSRQVF